MNCVESDRQPREWNEPEWLRESVHCAHNDHVSQGSRQTCDKINREMEPLGLSLKCCNRMAPMLISKATISTTNCLVVSGYMRTWAEVNASINLEKASSAVEFHASFLVTYWARVDAILLKHLREHYQKLEKPKNHCSSFKVVGVGQVVTAATFSVSMATLSMLIT